MLFSVKLFSFIFSKTSFTAKNMFASSSQGTYHKNSNHIMHIITCKMQCCVFESTEFTVFLTIKLDNRKSSINPNWYRFDKDNLNVNTKGIIVTSLTANLKMRINYYLHLLQFAVLYVVIKICIGLLSHSAQLSCVSQTKHRIHALQSSACWPGARYTGSRLRVTNYVPMRYPICAPPMHSARKGWTQSNLNLPLLPGLQFLC